MTTNCSACIAEGTIRRATKPEAVTVAPYLLPGLTVVLCDQHDATIATANIDFAAGLVSVDGQVVGSITVVGKDHKGIGHNYRCVILRVGQFEEKTIWGRRAAAEWFAARLGA
jgi:hypothetical protein